MSHISSQWNSYFSFPSAFPGRCLHQSQAQLLPAAWKRREEIYSRSRQEGWEELQSCPCLPVGQLKPNPSPSGFSPALTNPQKVPGAAVAGGAANSRDSSELKIGWCWRQLMLLLTAPSWVGYLQKKKPDGQGGTPAIFYRAAKSPLCPQLWELSISWHLVGKAGTVSCVEKKNKQQINWPQRNASMELNRKIKSADFLPWKSYNLSSNSRERQGRKTELWRG